MSSQQFLGPLRRAASGLFHLPSPFSLISDAHAGTPGGLRPARWKSVLPGTRTDRVLFFLACSALVLHTALLAVYPEARWSSLGSNLIQLLLGVLAVMAAGRAAARSKHFSRRVWFLVTAAAAIHTTGQAIVTVYDYLAAKPFLSPWLSDQFLFFWVVPLLVAVVVDPGDVRRRAPWTDILDFLQVLLLAMAWHFSVFGDDRAWMVDGPGMALLVWKVRLGRDLFLLACLWLRVALSELEGSRQLFRRIALFFTAFAIADISYLYLEAVLGVQFGTMMDVAWSLPRWLLIFLSVRWVYEERESDQRVRRRRGLLLHVASLVAPLLILLMASNALTTSTFLEVLLGASIACAGARVLVTKAFQEKVMRELTRNRNLLSAVVEGTTQAIYLKDVQGRFLLVNTAAAQLLGREVRQVLGRKDEDLLPPEAMRQAREWDRTVISTGCSITSELAMPVGTETLTLHSTKAPYFDSSGQVAGILGIAVDISSLKETQNELLRWKSRCESALKASGQVMYEQVPESGEIFLDGSVDGFLGYTQGELPASMTGWRQLVHPEDRTICDEVTGRAIRERGNFRCEYRMRDKDGSYRHVVEHGRVFASAAGRPYRIIGSVQDVTQMRRAQERLKSAQRLESLGTLAAGVAHDFNNLLTVIHGYSELLLARPEASVTEAARSIHQASESAAVLVRQLLTFSRQQQVAPRILNLNQSVIGIHKMLRRLMPENVEIRVELDSHQGNVKADPGQMEQIIINLAVNARDAMPGGGALTLSTRNAVVSESEAGWQGVPASEYVVLSVEDSGSGMSPEVQARIFEPFFTTKGPGRGTGLGLATVHGIVTQSGGHIRVESEPGQGSIFEVYLPKCAGKVGEVVPTSPVLLRARGQERILLVEDDPNVRAMVARTLEGAGFKVTGVDDPRMALHLVKRHPEEIDLIVTDLMLPGMNGRELSWRIREFAPASRVVFMTGHIESGIVDQVVADSQTVLQKPFTSGRLLDTVRRALDG